MGKRFRWVVALYLLPFLFLANCYLLVLQNIRVLWAVIPAFVLMLLFAGTVLLGAKRFGLRVCGHGTVLLSVFIFNVTASVIYHIGLGIHMLSRDIPGYWGSVLFCAGAHFILFWAGILCVYLASHQLGIKYRVIGAICGMIPIVNLFALNKILRISFQELEFEIQKEKFNASRKEQQVCATKYPILLVHGVFFRDFAFFNYWGRIPRELEINGARIFYGNQQSADAVADCAAELADRIRQILAETGAEKVNIIAHSKGGLDCRYAMAKLGVAPLVASLTTINTPHRGCLFADYLLTKIPEDTQQAVASAYNKALKKLGDPNPDFMSAIQDLTDATCQPRDEEFPAPDGVFCQSVGSVLANASSGRFPLNFSYLLAKHFDGENDGLVSENSFCWGEKYTLLRPTGKVGISHSDMIDLGRKNLEDFDVREFYVNLVSDLKSRGL